MVNMILSSQKNRAVMKVETDDLATRVIRIRKDSREAHNGFKWPARA